MPPARKRAASASAKKPASAEKKSKGDAPMTAEQEAMAKAKANAAARRQANEDKKATEAESKKSVVAPAKPAAKSRSRAASSPSPVRAETPEQVAKDAAKANATSRKRASTSTAKPAKPAASSRRSSRAAPIELSSDEDEEEEELVVKPARGRASTSTTSPAPKSGASTTAHTARTQSSVSPMKKAPVASPKPVPVRVNAAAAIGRRGASMSPQPPARPPSRGSNNANAPYAGSAAGGSRPSTGTTRSPTPSAKGNKPESPTSAAKRIAAQNAAERRLQDAYEAETIQQEDRGRASNNQGDLTAEQEAVRQAKVMSEERRRKNNRASSAGPSDRSSGNLNNEGEEEEEPKVDTWNRGVFDQDNAPFWVEHMDALSVGLVALVICSVVYFHSSDVTAAISGSTASVAKTVAGPVNKLMYLLIILFPIVYMATVQGWWNYLLGLLNGLNVDPADAEREHSRFRAEQYQNQTFQSQSQPPAQSVSPVRNRAKSPSVSGRQSQPYSYSASGRREVPGELRSDHTSSSSSSSAEAARTSSSTNSNTPAASFLANLSWKQKIIAAALSACAVLFSIAYYKIQYEMYMDSALYSLGAVAIIGALIFTYIYSSKSQQNELVLELSKYIKTRTRNTHESVPIEHLMWNIKDFADDKKWPADTPSALTTLTSSEIHGLWEPAVAIVKTDVRFRITQDTSTGRKMEHIQFTGPRNKPPGNITRPTFASTGSSYSFSANANPGHQSFQRF